jgi:hypothetical protein
MMKLTFKAMHLVCLALFFGLNIVAHGYEVDTHEKISNAAAKQFIDLKHYDFTTLGLVSLDDNLTAEGLKCRSEKLSSQSALEWIQEGSVCEDDTRTEVYFRYKNHFYDPQHSGQGYTGFLWRDSGIMRGMPAPDWIIDKGPADGQLYSFNQGRQYFYKALTATSDAERKENLARMFRTLGDVMHVLQDMAQPQHTRNDSHGIPKSWYEVYTDNKRLPYTGEAIPNFATARKYFTELANFSSYDFVSAGTNFDVATNLGYNLPTPGETTGISPEVLAVCSASNPCVMTFYSTSQTITNPRASALSILDQYLKLRQVPYIDPETSNIYFKNRIFTLNKFTFDEALPYLIPRATAYSAGILDYFFRGKIDMVNDPNNPGKYVITNWGTEDMTGDFALYYDAVDGNRYPVPGAAWSGLSVSARGQANNLSFAWPVNPAPQTPGEFTLVFSGSMGAEQAGYNSLGVTNSSIGAIVAKKVVPRTYATWDTDRSNSNIVFSNNKLTTSWTIDDQLAAIATIGRSSGKWYWEIVCNTLPTPLFERSTSAGIGTANISRYLNPGIDAYGWTVQFAGAAMHGGVLKPYGTTFVDGDVAGFALNMDNGEITVYRNGVSQGVMYNGLSEYVYPVVGGTGRYGSEVISFTANFGQSAFTYSVPSGYNPGLYE